jgi:hypothetical protein
MEAMVLRGLDTLTFLHIGDGFTLQYAVHTEAGFFTITRHRAANTATNVAHVCKPRADQAAMGRSGPFSISTRLPAYSAGPLGHCSDARGLLRRLKQPRSLKQVVHSMPNKFLTHPNSKQIAAAMRN